MYGIHGYCRFNQIVSTHIIASALYMYVHVVVTLGNKIRIIHFEGIRGIIGVTLINYSESA